MSITTNTTNTDTASEAVWTVVESFTGVTVDCLNDRQTALRVRDTMEMESVANGRRIPYHVARSSRHIEAWRGFAPRRIR